MKNMKDIKMLKLLKMLKQLKNGYTDCFEFQEVALNRQRCDQQRSWN